MEKTGPPTASRVEALDSLRFLAASAVMLAHFRALEAVKQADGFFLAGLLDPRSAVLLFFVLSGLVLHLSWKGAQPGFSPTMSFYVRRWFRIYPLYYAALAIGIIVTSQLPLGESLVLQRDSATAHVIATSHADVWQWLHHVVLISPHLDSTFLVPPIWTLAEEMRVSLVFPWLSWLVGRLPRCAGLGVIALLFGLAPLLAAWIAPAAGLLPLFALGAWIAQHHREMRMNAALAGLIGLALYVCAFHGHWRLQQASCGIGAALIMLAILRGPQLRKVLSHPLLTLGGRCSYGIYALHFPLMLFVAWWVERCGWPEWLRYAIGLPLCVAVALALHFAIEQPMIRLGRRFTSRA